MPKLLVYKNYYIYLIFSLDINESRKHIHVAKKSVKNFSPAKIWLEPEVEIVKKGDFKDNEIKEITKIADKYRDELINQINRYFNNEIIRIIKI